MRRLFSRVAGRVTRTLANQFHRRMVTISSSVPIISFTFDDAPKTAFIIGGGILRSHGINATYFVSLGLLGAETEVGVIASPEELSRAVMQGNELGCHTFDHLDAWQTPTARFMESVIKNRQTLDEILPEATFLAFAYPKSGASLSLKKHLEKRFACCRGGGQTPNVGTADLNLLKACFLDKRTGVDANWVRQLINYNALNRGWLILATHDVTDNPSPYGCTPEFFGEVVEHAARSGALVLPLGEACRHLVGPAAGRIALT